MRGNPLRIVATAAVALAVAACRDQRPLTAPRAVPAADLKSVVQAGRYLVVFTTPRVPADFGVQVAKLGGSVEASLDSVGVATVTGMSAAAAARLAAEPGIEAVGLDRTITLYDGAAAPDVDESSAPSVGLGPPDAAASPTAAVYYPRQWNMRAISANQAWAAGFLGSRDVVIGLLDSGIDYTLADFAGLIDLGRSRSFTPEEDPVVAARFPGRLPISDLLAHGTAVASVIASKGTMVAGVNQAATLIAVKVFNRLNQGSVAQLLGGLVYAADQGADVINMSLGDRFDIHTDRAIVAAFGRATNYAFRKGAVLVAAAMNDAEDLDHNGDEVVLPCEAPQVICVSATGPRSTAGVNGPWVDVDAFVALYSNYGRSAISVAAPGGTGDFANQQAWPNLRIWALCTTTPTEGSFPACKAGARITQPFGTSLSAAHVSGLAALLVAQLGHGNPALVRQRILQSADDLGEPGMDPYYGMGRINAARALGVLP